MINVLSSKSYKNFCMFKEKVFKNSLMKRMVNGSRAILYKTRQMYTTLRKNLFQ